MSECDVDIKMNKVYYIEKWSSHCKTPEWNEVFVERIDVGFIIISFEPALTKVQYLLQ